MKQQRAINAQLILPPNKVSVKTNTHTQIKKAIEIVIETTKFNNSLCFPFNFDNVKSNQNQKLKAKKKPAHSSSLILRLFKRFCFSLIVLTHCLPLLITEFFVFSFVNFIREIKLHRLECIVFNTINRTLMIRKFNVGHLFLSSRLLYFFAILPYG